MVDDIGTVFRDFNNINDPASGEYEPEKPRIRGLLRSIRALSGQAVTKGTLAALNAVTPPTENYMGVVLDDPDPTKNGYYSRVAAAWVWQRGFPDTVAQVTLGGSANAQTGAVAAWVDPGSVLVFFATVSTENTGPMTLSHEGETARDVVNAAGNALSAGEWAGTVVYFLNGGGDYQLLFDAGAAAAAAASANAAAASASDADIDRVAAELARDQAQAAASAVSVVEFSNIAAAEAYAPVSAPDFIRTAGYASAGDGGGALYKKVASEPSHAGKFSITLDDGVTVVWYEIAETEPNVLMFGAVGDGVTSNEGAFQAAVDYAKLVGTLHFPEGSYLVSDFVSLDDVTNLTFQGHGVAEVFATTRIAPAYFRCSDGSASNIKVFDMTFDSSHALLPLFTSADFDNTYNAAFHFIGGSNFVVQRCLFKSLYTRHLWFYTFSGKIDISQNRFSSPQQGQNQSIEHIYIQTTAAQVTITENKFEAAAPTGPSNVPCGIFCSGVPSFGSVKIDGNYFTNYGRDNTGSHRLGVIDFYGDVYNVTVTNNIADNCWGEFMRLNACRKGYVANNKITMHPSGEAEGNSLTVQGSTWGDHKGAQDIIVENNLIIDTAMRTATLLSLYAYDWGYPSTGIKFLNNEFVGGKQVIALQGPYHGVIIRGNSSRDGRGQINVTPFPVMESTYGAENTGAYDGLVIENNHLRNALSAAGPSINIDIYNSSGGQTTAFIGQHFIRDNVILADTTNSLSGVTVRLANDNGGVPGNNSGNLVIERNWIRNYALGLFLRDVGLGFCKENYIRAATTPIQYDDPTIWRSDRNVFAGGQLTGVATLVAGAVTVSNSEVRTGDMIILSHAVPGGTLGHLYLNGLSDGVSFTINSSSATDTSTIVYEIVH